MNKFLVQYKMDCDDEIHTSFMSQIQVIDFINCSDFNGVVDVIVYDISEWGNVKPLKYVGWQPMCLIQLVNENGEVVISGYGEDH